jgi:riboflavin kinase/FMN adenylyltransferase
MHLVRRIDDFPYTLVEQGSILTIGSFDGLHLGHQYLLNRILDESKASGLPSVVMSFEPTPGEFFSHKTPPSRLMRFREKFDALKEAGINIFFCPRFDQGMQNIQVDDFIRILLIQKLNIKFLVIGDDFRFARNREGSFDHLKRVQRILQFELQKMPSITKDNERVSSTLIREALHSGDLDKATNLLGKPYRMSGRIVMGKKLGRSLGYPTANVNIQRLQSAIMGIFAVRVYGVTSEPLDAVASLGTRPTFYEGKKPLLEVHIFDFNQEIYGQYIHVDFISKIRDEAKFDNAQDLIMQMDNDATKARKILLNKKN